MTFEILGASAVTTAGARQIQLTECCRFLLQYVGDEDGEYDRELNAVWVADGRYWDFQEDPSPVEVIAPDTPVHCWTPTNCRDVPVFEP